MKETIEQEPLRNETVSNLIEKTFRTTTVTRNPPESQELMDVFVHDEFLVTTLPSFLLDESRTDCPRTWSEEPRERPYVLGECLGLIKGLEKLRSKTSHDGLDNDDTGLTYVSHRN